MTQDANAKSAPTLGSLCLVQITEKELLAIVSAAFALKPDPLVPSIAEDKKTLLAMVERMSRENGMFGGPTRTIHDAAPTAKAAPSDRGTQREGLGIGNTLREAWIPVAERMPSDGDEVIVAWNDRGIMKRHYAWRFRGEWRSVCGDAVAGVTHWLPLPSCLVLP